MNDLMVAIENAQKHWNNALPSPENEAAVCDWVVRPLLHAAGYSYYEIEPQARDFDGTIPDFTIHPGMDATGIGATWFLEAKFWRNPLTSSHQDQAISYARRNNRRWSVLTNGKYWQLLDSHETNGRVVLAAVYSDTEGMVNFLSTISRNSMRVGETEILARLAAQRKPAPQHLPDLHQKPAPKCSTFEQLMEVVEIEKAKGWKPFFGMAQSPITRFTRSSYGENGMVRIYFFNRKTEQEDSFPLTTKIAATGNDQSRIWFANEHYTYPPRKAATEYRPRET